MDSILQIKNLTAGYGKKKIITGISLELKPGEILGIVGESGCGKSTLLRTLLRQKGSGCRIFSGEVLYQGENLTKMPSKTCRRLYGTEIGMVFQNSSGAFNPLRTFRSQFADTLKSHGIYQPGTSEQKILEAFRRLDLPDGKALLNSRPFEMSGGMNQRIAIAMNMMLQPKVLLADEPTSALDVSSQQQVMEELAKLRDNCGTAIILVTHNIGLIRKMADRVMILYAGRIAECGESAAVIEQPLHPYTRALLRAVPSLGGEIPIGVDGIPPLNGAELEECAFAPRCEFCDSACNRTKPTLHPTGADHFTSCARSTAAGGN